MPLCRKSRFVLLVLVFLGALADAHAEIYKWTDADGQVQFSDRPPPEGPAEEVRLPPVNTYQGVSIEEFQDMRSERPHGGKAKKVVMYSAPWCGVCKQAKQFFQAKGIQIRELNVEKNRMARLEMERMNARGVPVILVGGKRMNGFSARRFMELYEK